MLQAKTDYFDEGNKMQIHKIHIFECFLIKELGFDGLLAQSQLFRLEEQYPSIEQTFKQKLDEVNMAL